MFQKIPTEWLEKAVERFDELSVEEFSKFEANLETFVVDGSALSGESLKQKKGAVRKSMRKAAREDFDEKKYRRRKLGERPFGNIKARRSKCYYKTPESKLKGAILIACNHNIIAYFKNRAWCDLFVEL